jgi:RHS repeat-associated protein
VATPQGYTKHYYSGSVRIASAIGLGGLEIIDQPLTLENTESWHHKKDVMYEHMYGLIVHCLHKDFDVAQNGLHILHNMTVTCSSSVSLYFYHPDHLGSTSWITDRNGDAIQYLHYLPFGEEWIDQRSTSWNAQYSFTGKIKDAETGYNYFGARYYDSGLSVWLSVDPLSDKYPTLSPYTYCANNPIMMVDPDGRRINIAGLLYRPNSTCPNQYPNGSEVSNTTKIIWNALEAINDHPWGEKVISELSSSTTTVVDFNVGDVSDPNAAGQTSKKTNSNGSNIEITENNINGSFAKIHVAHELFHAYQNHYGVHGISIFKEVEANLFTHKIFGLSGLQPSMTADSPPDEIFYNSVLQYATNQYDPVLIDHLVNNFQNCSNSNTRGLYNDFPLRNKPNQTSILQNFYNLK